MRSAFVGMLRAHKPADSGAGVGYGARICGVFRVTPGVLKHLWCGMFIALKYRRFTCRNRLLPLTPSLASQLPQCFVSCIKFVITANLWELACQR
jgi:hypothetical protein